jgi:hypothetical protein
MAWGSASMGSFARGTRDVLTEWSPEDQAFARFILDKRPDIRQAMLRRDPNNSAANMVNDFFFGQGTGDWKRGGSIGTGNGTSLLNYAKQLGWQDTSPVYTLGDGSTMSQAEMGQRLFQAGWGGENGSVLQNNGASDADVLNAFTRTQGGQTSGGTTAPQMVPGTPPPGWPPGVPFLVPAAGQQQTLQNQQSQIRANNEAEQRRIMEQQSNANYQTRVGEIGQNSRNYIQSLFLGTPQTVQPAPAIPTDGSVPYWWPQGVAWPNIPAGQVPTPEQIDTYLAAWDSYERNRINEQGQNQTRQLAESSLAANYRPGYQGNQALMATVAAQAKQNPFYQQAYERAGLGQDFSAGSNPTFGFVAGRHIPVRDMLNMNSRDRGIMESFASYSGQDPADLYQDFEIARPKGQVAAPTRFR